VSRQATGERQSFRLLGRDVDQNDVGTKRDRHVLCAVAAVEVGHDLESLGLEERFARASKGRVRVDDQHTNLLSGRLPPVLLVLHASTMPPAARGRIGVAAGHIAGQAEVCSPRSIRARSARDAICNLANTLRRW
jgi:hypothetical protein